MEKDLHEGDLFDKSRVAQRPSTTETLQQEWRRIRTIAVQLQDYPPACTEAIELIKELLEVVDGEDSLLAFTAMQTLAQLLPSRLDAMIDHSLCRNLLLQVSDTLPTAHRLQLVRQLIRPPKHHEDDCADETESDSGEEAEPSSSEGVLHAILVHFNAFRNLVLAAMEQVGVADDVVHEALVLFTEVIKRVAQHATEDGAALNAIGDLLSIVVDRATTWDFGSTGTPTYLATDVIDLLLDAKHLFHIDDVTSEPDRSRLRIYWLASAARLVSPGGSPSALVLRVLGTEQESVRLCAESFVSSSSLYPMVQKWILLAAVSAECVVAELSFTEFERLRATQHSRLSWGAWASTFPSRESLLSVLIEQDDIMVEVLLKLLAVARSIGQLPWITRDIHEHVTRELHPALLFSDYLSLLGDDHLVILDMLTSSETQMLPYIVQILRFVGEQWTGVRTMWQAADRRDAVVGVLIRLRMEIARLQAGGLFPYNPTPLLRRLEHVDDLNEADIGR